MSNDLQRRARNPANLSNGILFEITRWCSKARLWNAETEPLNHDPAELIRTQDLAPVFVENSCLYVFERESFLEHGNRIGDSPIKFEIEPNEAIDIDQESEFSLVECISQSEETSPR